MGRPSPPDRAAYDPAQRQAAARLAREHPGWYVTWGTWSRRYFAYPVFDAPPGTLITASGTSELLARMRQTELTATPDPPGQWRAPHPAKSREGGSRRA